ncbi:hypothetical protein SLS62_004929 [Diatrype stigma]|uniref:Cytochrome P450 n=1 Tax=Diatrype stigma TaxID=117547 RepID=A0AAN9UTN7_9PEZI
MIHSLLAVIAGLIAHHGFFINGEWHMRGVQIISTHVAMASALLGILSRTNGTWGGSLHGLITMAIWYFTALFTSMTIYRLFFHATSSFPGPKLAAVTKLWHILHVRDSRNYLLMQKLHSKYGKFVRTGPNEISIFHPGALHSLDGWNNENTKDVWYDVLQPRQSAIFVRDEFAHKGMHKTWTKSLSTKAMDSLRPRLAEQAHSLTRCIASYGTEPIDVREVMSWFSFDAMGEAVFGEDFGLLNSRVAHPEFHNRELFLGLLGPTADAIWITRLAFSLLRFYGGAKGWFGMVSFCDKRMKSRLENGPKDGKTDIASWFIDDYKDLQGKVDSKTLDNHLNGTALTAVVAGSGTTRASLIATCWYLSKYPEHADKIRTEIQGVDIHDANSLALLPHLNGTISEVLRLVPPQLTGGSRISGPNGLLLDGTFIPPFTKITAPKYVVQRLPSAFEFPHEFIPERWYSRPELVHDRRAFGPFSFGTFAYPWYILFLRFDQKQTVPAVINHAMWRKPRVDLIIKPGNRQCVGKVLAWAELRLVTASLLQHYSIRFAPGYDPDLMWRDMQDQVAAQPGPVFCIFEPRK